MRAWGAFAEEGAGVGAAERGQTDVMVRMCPQVLAQARGGTGHAARQLLKVEASCGAPNQMSSQWREHKLAAWSRTGVNCGGIGRRDGEVDAAARHVVCSRSPSAPQGEGSCQHRSLKDTDARSDSREPAPPAGCILRERV